MSVPGPELEKDFLEDLKELFGARSGVVGGKAFSGGEEDMTQ